MAKPVIVDKSKGLSILIPVYNHVCYSLVERLSALCEAAQPLNYEILVADDASIDARAINENLKINALPNCSYIVKEKNEGAGATRNYLVKSSRYVRLLFLDCDVEVEDDFITEYLATPDADVVNGGMVFAKPKESLEDEVNLRYRYEVREIHKHSTENRTRRPYASFRSTNFMAKRNVMEACPFDERMKRYEDVYFGKQLEQCEAVVLHIDNPVIVTDYDDNATYLMKVEKDMRSLSEFRYELDGFSPLLALASRLGIMGRTMVCLFHKLFGRAIRRNLVSKNPKLWLLNFYKLGYFVTSDFSHRS